jgi:hypothetical protein
MKRNLLLAIALTGCATLPEVPSNGFNQKAKTLANILERKPFPKGWDVSYGKQYFKGDFYEATVKITGKTYTVNVTKWQPFALPNHSQPEDDSLLMIRVQEYSFKDVGVNGTVDVARLPNGTTYVREKQIGINWEEFCQQKYEQAVEELLRHSGE